MFEQQCAAETCDPHRHRCTRMTRHAVHIVGTGRIAWLCVQHITTAKRTGVWLFGSHTWVRPFDLRTTEALA